MKILLNFNQKQDTALEYFRQQLPHKAMLRNFPDVSLNGQYPTDVPSIDSLSDEDLSSYDIVCFLRQVVSSGDAIKRCKDLGVKVVFDIDDYWNLPNDHLMKRGQIFYNFHKKVPKWIQEADLVTTTTKRFQDIIREDTGVEAVVLPNCIDPLESQFQDITPTVSKRVRFGWIGGVHHRPDLELMSTCFSKLFNDKQIFKEIQLCLGGFTPNQEYFNIEKLMTCSYALMRSNPDYLKYLKEYSPLMEHYSLNKPYRRLWGMDVRNYAKLYNEIDVAFVPLRGNVFSSCKSELKLIEAGWFNKPVIVSDVLPYNSIVKDGENGLIATDWKTEIEEYLDPDFRKEMGEALGKVVREKFDINEWSKTRYELYKQLIK